MKTLKTLSEWQEEFAVAAQEKYSNNKRWTQQDRVLAVLRQLADVGGAIQKEMRIFETKDSAHEDPNYRIAALMADILILCHKRGVDLDSELRKVLKWFRTPKPHPLC